MIVSVGGVWPVVFCSRLQHLSLLHQRLNRICKWMCVCVEKPIFCIRSIKQMRNLNYVPHHIPPCENSKEKTSERFDVILVWTIFFLFWNPFRRHSQFYWFIFTWIVGFSSEGNSSRSSSDNTKHERNERNRIYIEPYVQMGKRINYYYCCYYYCVRWLRLSAQPSTQFDKPTK